MSNVVITGSSRGLGYAMAKVFLQKNCNVTICSRNQDAVQQAVNSLPNHSQSVLGVSCDVQQRDDIVEVWQRSALRFGAIDVWINNAGVNQQGRTLRELSPQDVQSVLDTNLRGAIFGTQIALSGMLQQGYGQIFNVEGFGSNDMQRTGLNLYGTTKRALTHFTTACAKEAADTPILIGLLSPGMMATDFLREPSGEVRGGQNTKRIFNILGDTPDTVAQFLATRILRNRQNGAHIVWLTKRKILWRFARSPFVKQDLFKE